MKCNLNGSFFVYSYILLLLLVAREVRAGFILFIHHYPLND